LFRSLESNLQLEARTLGGQMLRSSHSMLLVAAAAAVLLSACNNNTTTPTTPTQATLFFPGADPETATLTVNGAQTYAFTMPGAGTVSLQLDLLDPDTDSVGLALGTWNTTTGTCNIILSNDIAVIANGVQALTTVVTGTTSGAGSLCTRIYDNGTLTAAATFRLKVTLTY
jgi:hypothetical protein